MTRRTRAAVAVLLAALVLSGVTSGAAGAQATDSDTPFADLLDDEDDGLAAVDVPSLGAAWAAVNGAMDRTVAGIAGYAPDWLAATLGVDDDDATADDLAADAAAFYNERNASFEAWINARTNASTSHDVVRITWEVGDESAERYLVATVTDGNYTNTNMTATTSRTIDDSVTVCGYAARESVAELKQFHEEVVEPGADVTDAYQARLAGAYSEDVESTLLPTNGDCGGAS